MKFNYFHIIFNTGRLKSIGLVLLLSLFLFNTGGYFFYLKILQYCIHEEVRNQIKGELPERDLCRIIVTPGERSLVQWKENDREFMYHGEMYDVVKKETLGQNTRYYCINDKKETLLIANLIRHHRDNELLHKILKRFDNIKYFPKTGVPPGISSTFRALYPQPAPFYTPAVPEISDPPPEMS